MKYLEKGEFRDLKYVKNIKLDGNQLSVIIDNLFESQRNLEFLGNKTTIYRYIRKTIQTKVETMKNSAWWMMGAKGTR